jgi:hypothetical protein
LVSTLNSETEASTAPVVTDSSEGLGALGEQ